MIVCLPICLFYLVANSYIGTVLLRMLGMAEKSVLAYVFIKEKTPMFMVLTESFNMYGWVSGTRERF